MSRRCRSPRSPLTDDVEQRDLIEQTDQLDHQDPGRQHGGAAEEGVLLRLWCHAARGWLCWAMGNLLFVPGRGGPARLPPPLTLPKIPGQGIALHLRADLLQIQGEELSLSYMTRPRAIFITTLEPRAE